MNIDALHSALLSLTVLPEQLRSARENVSTANGGEPSAFEEFLNTTERDLRIAKATLARELGFPICNCCWPPELLALTADGRTCCPASSASPLTATGEATQLPSPSLLPRNRDVETPRMDAFTRSQKEKLLSLRDSVVDSITGVVRGNSRAEANGSAGGWTIGDEADAGNDAFERDFALSVLAQEHDALSEIDHALRRIERGIYNICEMSGELIPRARLEAIPFARYTVECQAQLERRRKSAPTRRPARTLAEVLGPDEDDGEEDSSAIRSGPTPAERIVAFESAEASLHFPSAVG